MRILSVATATALAIAVLPATAGASAVASADFVFGTPLSNFQTNANAQGVTRVAASNTDINASGTGTFIDYSGTDLHFANGANSFDLTNIVSNLTTGVFSGSINGAAATNLFDYQNQSTNLAALEGQNLILLDSAFVTYLTTHGIQVPSKNIAGTVSVNVPEPAALALFGLGAAVLGFARRRAK